MAREEPGVRERESTHQAVAREEPGVRERESDIDDQNLPICNFEVPVIFWDDFISNDRTLIEAVLQEFKMRWSTPRFNVFVCAGDFAQVCIYLRLNLLSFNTLHLSSNN